MWEDEIIKELHRIREEYAKSFNYDLDAMFIDWQKKQDASDRKIVRLSIGRGHSDAVDQLDERSRASL